MVSVPERDGAVEMCAIFSGATSQNFIQVRISNSDSSPGKRIVVIALAC